MIGSKVWFIDLFYTNPYGEGGFLEYQIHEGTLLSLKPGGFFTSAKGMVQSIKGIREVKSNYIFNSFEDATKYKYNHLDD